MYSPNLEDLYLTDEELQTAKEQIKDMAFRDWREAGCPNGCDQVFWENAKLEWIEYRYVPDRYSSEGSYCDPLNETV